MRAHYRHRLLIWLRCLGFGRNPLRRRSDLVESIALMLVLFGALAVLPIAVQVGQAAFEHGVRTSAQVAAGSHRSVAVLLENAEVLGSSVGDSGSSGVSHANATWSAPDGTQRSGVIEVGYGDRAGQRISLWTNDNGDPLTPPKTATDLRTEAIMVGLLFAAGWSVLLGAGYAVCRMRLNRRRLAQWDTEWARVSEKWRRHTP